MIRLQLLDTRLSGLGFWVRRQPVQRFFVLVLRDQGRFVFFTLVCTEIQGLWFRACFGCGRLCADCPRYLEFDAAIGRDPQGNVDMK
jgi:hypothetical protein